jgi:hypothetical protein
MAAPESVNLRNLSGTYNLVSVDCDYSQDTYMQSLPSTFTDMKQNKSLSDSSDAALQMVPILPCILAARNLMMYLARHRLARPSSCQILKRHTHRKAGMDYCIC